MTLELPTGMCALHAQPVTFERLFWSSSYKVIHESCLAQSRKLTVAVKTRPIFHRMRLLNTNFTLFAAKVPIDRLRDCVKLLSERIFPTKNLLLRVNAHVFNFCSSRTSMEDSSHSTPSPMSSAASSQDSLHRGLHNPYQHLMTGSSSLSPAAAQAAAAAAKKKGVKSTLGRIFGKKDKQLKAMKEAPYVTMPMSNSPSGGFAPHQMHPMSQHPSAASSIYGDFDRRKKKRYFKVIFLLRVSCVRFGAMRKVLATKALCNEFVSAAS